jgi:hypothetical protein
MAMPPPPPGAPEPPPPPPVGVPAPPPPPPGYNPYGAVPAQQKNNGMAIASLVLSLVGIIPCFWVLQVPGLLGIIFGFVGRGQIRRSGGTQKGNGMALAGIVIGIVLIVAAVLFVVLLATSDSCNWNDGRFECVSN